MSHKARQTKSESRKKLERDLVLVSEAFSKEAEARYSALRRKADEAACSLRVGLLNTVESLLPQEILEANFLDFVRNNSMFKECLEQLCISENSSENAIDIASEAVSAFERLAIPVDKSSSTNEGLDGESVRTPLQENNAFANLPSVIRPKVEEVRARKFRSARGGEVAFSVDGSPLVVPRNVTDDLESAAFKQIITGDGETLTPASRDAVSTVKRLVLKKISEVQRSPPQSL